MIPARWLIFGAWLIGVAVHLVTFIAFDESPQGAEWYASRPSYKMALFWVTRFPLWIFALCLLVVVISRMRRVPK